MLRLIRVLALLIYSLVAPLLPRVQARDDNDLLSILRTGHGSVRESIRTFSAAISIEDGIPDRKPSVTGKYWRTSDSIRVHEDYTDGRTEDYLARDSQVRQVGRYPIGGSRHQYGAARKSLRDAFCRCDVWERMLLDLPSPRGRDSLDELLGLSNRHECSRRRENGRDCIYLDLAYDDPDVGAVHLAAWFDVGFNYLVRKISITFGKTGKGRAVLEILRFVEPLPEHFFPEQCRSRTYEGDELVSDMLVTLSDVRINDPIPPSVFRLPGVPSGTMLSDKVQGKQYRINEKWQRIGPESSATIGILPPTPDAEDVEYRTQTAEEPRSLTRWLIPASLAVLGVAGCGLLYRRYRAGSYFKKGIHNTR